MAQILTSKRLTYSVFYGFGQAKLAHGASILGSSHFFTAALAASKKISPHYFDVLFYSSAAFLMT